MKLKEFQTDAISQLVLAIESGYSQITFKSCTGSGKTIVLTNMIADFYRSHPNAIFVWLTPGKGNLEEQSKKKMDFYLPNSRTASMEEVLQKGFAPRETSFLNWEKLTKSGNVALREGEGKNFADWVKDAQLRGYEFYVVMDESHQNDTAKSKAIIDLLNPKSLIRSSATPSEIKGAFKVEVPDWKVIEQGLIKKKILVNQGFAQGIEIEDEVAFLLEEAFEKYGELVHEYSKTKDEVNPLILVQLENDNDELRHRVEEWFEGKGISYDNGLLAVWLSGDSENRDDIEKVNGKQIALIFKQAIATGWDCPRAQILVKLRDNMSETFSIQTIGRIRRMPCAHHYLNEKLDNCYIYTLDERFVSEAKAASDGRMLDAKYIKLKDEYKDISLVSEQRGILSNSGDDKLAFQSIHAHLKTKYSLGDDVEKNIATLESQGYVFGKTVSDTTKSGSVDEIEADQFSNLSTVSLSVTASKRDLHDEFNNVVYKLAIKLGFGAGDGYSRFAAILRRLFDKRMVQKNKKRKGDFRNILALSLEELYRFVINNKTKLQDDCREALSSVRYDQSLDLELVEEKTFNLPREMLFTFDVEAPEQDVCSKSVYEYYLISASPRSSVERRFELFCEEQSQSINWFYKNGDKGAEYLSIIYADNSGKQKAFYPDYLVGVGEEDEIWIIETKGGFGSSGQDEDIDDFSPKKHAVLRKYCVKHSLKGGFVREDKRTARLMICDFESEYSSDSKDDNWKKLTDVLG